jgi:hypothetical protein
MNEPGTVSIGQNETLLIEVEGESYWIGPEEVRSLLFYSKAVPVYQAKRRTGSDGEVKRIISIEGHAAINRAGKAVLIFTRAGYYIIPIVSFRKVAKGEVVSAPLFPLRSEIDGGAA